MKNTKFLQNIFTLLFGSFLVKILSIVIRSLLGRLFGVEGIGYYTLIMPTYGLIVSLSYFAIPTYISKLISEEKYSTKKILSSGIFLSLGVNLICMIIFLISSPYLATYLLHEEKCTYLLIACSLSMPFMGLACVLKGYFFGKQRMFANSISNILEQLIRIGFLVFILPPIIEKNLIQGIFYYLLVSIVTECVSIITFLVLLPKGKAVQIKEITYDQKMISILFKGTFPLVFARLLGNFTYFLEPILLSNLFLYQGYPSTYFTLEYGILNGYSLSLLMMPSFITMAIGTALIPEVSKRSASKKRLVPFIKVVLTGCFLLGVFSTIGITLLREPLLSFFYGNIEGSNYLVYLSFIFPLYYLETPLISILQALNSGKELLSLELMISLIRLLLQGIFCYLFGFIGMIYSLYVTLPLMIYLLFRQLKKKVSLLNE